MFLCFVFYIYERYYLGTDGEMGKYITSDVCMCITFIFIFAYPIGKAKDDGGILE